MTLLLNSFEGGTSGTTITTGNSGGTSGSAFDFAGIGASAVNAFDNAHAAHGSLSGKLSTPASATFAYWVWAASFPSVAQAWFRLYAYFTGNPSAQHRIWNCSNGGGSVMSVQVTTSGKLLVTYSSSGTTFVTFTAAIPLSAWFRVEGFAVSSATAGQVSLSLYDTMDSATPTETHTSAANLNTTASGNPTTYNFGASSSTANAGPFWMDDIGLSSAGAIGPVVPPSGSKARTPASLPSLITTL